MITTIPNHEKLVEFQDYMLSMDSSLVRLMVFILKPKENAEDIVTEWNDFMLAFATLTEKIREFNEQNENP